MEAFFIFIAKSCGLLVLFYCAYYFLLRKETFFTSNRWFLLAGLITSIVLPFLVYTKEVWVDPTPMINLNLSQINVTQPIEESFQINWNYVFLVLYSIGFMIFVFKFLMDFRSLNSVLKGKKLSQQADFKFIDTTENIAPFSYFDYIVYNSSMYTTVELENIIEHEKVHSEQNHTFDVLISRVFCILFWFNPFVWLYKKAITQNLEFIADKVAAQRITDRRSYQYTLLKITTHENCVAITNHFYQSLIKKRIVMLNKNQSKKRNSWKFCVVVPALVAFVLLFQIETVAHEKPQLVTVKSNTEGIDVFKITKTTTDEEFNQKVKTLKENFDITASFSDLERNSKNELIAIKVELKKGNEIARQMEVEGNNAIKAFAIVISTLENGKLTVDFKTDETAITNNNIKALNNSALTGEKEIFINGEKATEAELNNLDSKEIESMDVSKKSGKTTIKIITKHLTKPIKISDKEVYINGVKSNQKEVSDLDQNTIESVDVNTKGNTVEITTKTVTNSNDSKTTTNVVTISGQQEKPIVYINGKLTSPDFDMNDIDPNKISSMNVLKGQKATEKYGSDGKNGVIEITTKTPTDKDGNEKRVYRGHPTIKSTSEISTTIKSDGKAKQLIIVDGVIVTDKSMSDLDSLDIKKMEIYKGAEAIAKYGEKGKNGVIVITTRK
ncbi:TonB-dependent receptor plug domain-containing protein [Flavobacterium sp. C3NV]|uniref:TonB-dependent receptor plug domain-containing protein n=1 Tax=Flavobacterium sp. C3NV TaxID=3393358 RepID=UPI0039902FE1